MLVPQVTDVFPFSEPVHVVWGRDLPRGPPRALGLRSSRTVWAVKKNNMPAANSFPVWQEKKNEYGALMGKIPIPIHFYRNNTLRSHPGLLSSSRCQQASENRSHIIRRGTHSRCSADRAESEMRHFLTFMRYFPCKSVLNKHICSTVRLSTGFCIHCWVCGDTGLPPYHCSHSRDSQRSGLRSGSTEPSLWLSHFSQIKSGTNKILHRN